jgi:hypothetical protein
MFKIHFLTFLRFEFLFCWKQSEKLFSKFLETSMKCCEMIFRAISQNSKKNPQISRIFFLSDRWNFPSTFNLLYLIYFKLITVFVCWGTIAQWFIIWPVCNLTNCAQWLIYGTTFVCNFTYWTAPSLCSILYNTIDHTVVKYCRWKQPCVLYNQTNC